MSNTPLRICLVAPLPPPYGGISHWAAMMFRYAETRIDIKLFSVDTAIRWRAVHDLAIWKRVVGGGLQFMRDIVLLCAALLVRRPHVVHLTTSAQLSVVRDNGVMLVAALFNVPVIYHIRFGRVPQISAENSREWRVMASAIAKAHTVVAIDAATENAIHQHLPNVCLKRIPNCINTENLPKRQNSLPLKRTVVFTGWVIATKGISELIDAWSRLQLTDWRLVLVGPGDPVYRKQLLDTYRPDAVEFLGELPHEDAMKQLAQADIFVLPSYTEGFPNVVLEAMALGKAIVASDVGAIPEMLADSCGILVKPRSVGGLAAAISRLIADEDERTAMGERARARALANYSLNAVFAAYMSLWRQAAGLQEVKSPEV